MLISGHPLNEFSPPHSPCSMVLIGKERCGSSRPNQSDCMQKFEELGSSRGKLQSAPRKGGWHHVSHARPGFWQHDESQSQETPSAIDLTSGWQKKAAQPGGSRNQAVALAIVVNTALDENTSD